LAASGDSREKDLDALAFSSSGTLWERLANLKDRLKGAYYTIVDAFFNTLGEV
jgi:hypothetical protein